MTTYNFAVALVNTKGEDTTQKLNEIFSDFLASETKGNARKLLYWAISLAKGELLTIDKADAKTLTDLVENTERMAALVKGQILNVFDETKEAA